MNLFDELADETMATGFKDPSTDRINVHGSISGASLWGCNTKPFRKQGY